MNDGGKEVWGEEGAAKIPCRLCHVMFSDPFFWPDIVFVPVIDESQSKAMSYSNIELLT